MNQFMLATMLTKFPAFGLFPFVTIIFLPYFLVFLAFIIVPAILEFNYLLD
jgi:hypothetical protein